MHLIYWSAAGKIYVFACRHIVGDFSLWRFFTGKIFVERYDWKIKFLKTWCDFTVDSRCDRKSKSEIKSRNRTNGNPAFIRSRLVDEQNKILLQKVYFRGISTWLTINVNFFLNLWLIFDKELELYIKRTSAYVELAQFPIRISVF